MPNTEHLTPNTMNTEQNDIREAVREKYGRAANQVLQHQSAACCGTSEAACCGKDPADLTFIILAVNEYGKAFALGYQRFQLATDQSQDIPFSSNVPQGTYNVHADAVAETPSRNLIRRASLESAAPLEQR